MTKRADFLPMEEHFTNLLNSLPQPQRDLFNTCQHHRIEVGFRGRSFIAYKINEREPEVLDEIVVEDFICNDEVGSSAELRSRITGKTMVVNYTPSQVFSLPVFIWLPLNMYVRWNTEAGSNVGSLGFPMMIRTSSRLHLRQRGVTYLETGLSFTKEFGQAALA